MAWQRLLRGYRMGRRRHVEGLCPVMSGFQCLERRDRRQTASQIANSWDGKVPIEPLNAAFGPILACIRVMMRQVNRRRRRLPSAGGFVPAFAMCNLPIIAVGNRYVHRCFRHCTEQNLFKVLNRCSNIGRTQSLSAPSG